MSEGLKASISLQLEQHQEFLSRLELSVKETKIKINLLQREMWWLEHPEVAYFTARTSWETNYGHSEWEEELCFCVYTVTGLDGQEMIDVLHIPLYFIQFPPLEEEVVDDHEGALKTYRNPFLCT